MLSKWHAMPLSPYSELIRYVEGRDEELKVKNVKGLFHNFMNLTSNISSFSLNIFS
jgi:hypothetical protein